MHSRQKNAKLHIPPRVIPREVPAVSGESIVRVYDLGLIRMEFVFKMPSVSGVDMERPVRIELTARNDFWRNAFFVEWSHQYPDRQLVQPAGRVAGATDNHFLAASEWLPDLVRVAGQCFSTVTQAPTDPGRRQIFRNLFTSGRD